MQGKNTKRNFFLICLFFKKNQNDLFHSVWRKDKYLVGLSVGLVFFLFFSKFKKLIFFLEKNAFTLKKTTFFQVSLKPLCKIARIFHPQKNPTV
jgi:hypothetical protein